MVGAEVMGWAWSSSWVGTLSPWSSSLSMMISGPKQPGNDIYVFLSPLIKDLKLMWDQGVEVFDGYANFQVACYFAPSMTFQHMVTYQVIVLRVIKHVQNANKTPLLNN